MSDISIDDDSDMSEPQSDGLTEDVSPVAKMSLPAPPWDLSGAITGNRCTNPRSSGNGDVNERHVKILLEQLFNSAPARHGDSTKQPTIYMVPHELKTSHYNTLGEYEPFAVCIGTRFYSKTFTLPPGSRYREGLLQLDKYKWCCARQLISRHNHLMEPAKTLVLLHGCFTSMKRLVPEIRASYSPGTLKTIGAHPDDEVAQLMLEDGCFILHRLLKNARRAKLEADGGGDDQLGDDQDWTQVYGRCGVWQLVTRDLLLPENQIPFFVIRELFQQLKNEDETEDLLVTGALRLFRSLRPQMLHRSPIACDNVHHLLHLFYLSVGLPPGDHRQQQQHCHHQSDALVLGLPQWIPCAKELEEAGVRFRKSKNATSFLDVKFARGVLEIPQLELNDSSESLLRNLIAFEQTYPETPRDVSTYAVFMDCLVTSEEDTRILELHGILVNRLGNRKIAWRFFSAITGQEHWTTDDNYLVSLMGAVNRYRDRRRHKWRAALLRNYFSNPWVTMSVFAALLLLAMSVLQTFFTVYAYFNPPSPN